MTSPQFFFAALAAIAVGAGLVVVLSRNVIHAAVFLAFALLAVAGFFLLLLADFLALLQVLIYAGAVTILVVFALMLTRQSGGSTTLDNPQKPWAAVAALLFLIVALLAIYGSPWPAAPAELQRVSYTTLGLSLFTTWAVPFEVVSLVLLVALIGAIVIARAEPRER
ncbi:MAG: NADH-quinone oxidoreductase subunit J [Chloroflexi bacterium]|nr:NADH-quinone oxidoreductase subunit J [Chloroflexota bacterium]